MRRLVAHELVVVLGVGDRGLEHLAPVARDRARREGEDRARLLDGLARGCGRTTSRALRADWCARTSRAREPSAAARRERADDGGRGFSRARRPRRARRPLVRGTPRAASSSAARRSPRSLGVLVGVAASSRGSAAAFALGRTSRGAGASARRRSRAAPPTASAPALSAPVFCGRGCRPPRARRPCGAGGAWAWPPRLLGGGLRRFADAPPPRPALLGLGASAALAFRCRSSLLTGACPCRRGRGTCASARTRPACGRPSTR